MQSLPQKSKQIFRAYLFIFTAVLEILFLTVPLCIVKNIFLFFGLQIFLFLCFFLALFLLLPRYFEQYRYAVSPGGLSIQKGFLFFRKIRIPAKKVLYTEILSNPLQRRYGLCTLIIYMTGADRILLSQIELSAAIHIKVKLNEQI